MKNELSPSGTTITQHQKQHIQDVVALGNGKSIKTRCNCEYILIKIKLQGMKLHEHILCMIVLDFVGTSNFLGSMA